jgi:hypothetical protein
MKSKLITALLSSGIAVGSLFAATLVTAQPKITSQKDLIGFTIGDDYHMASYTQISTMLKKWNQESDRLQVVSIGNTEEGRPQYMAIISSPANLQKLERYRQISTNLARARMGEAEAQAMAEEGKAVVWIDGGLHATETVNSQSLAEMVYQMVSRTDKETLRFLDDVVLLMPVPNPDGVELVANWYMRSADPKERTLNNLPRLYHKYVGHDNNRDGIMMSMSETVNQNRVLFVEWNPQIMHNVHQTGPLGAVIFIPPFRDPFNYDFDPLIPIGIEQVGAHMHARLVAKGMGGSAMRSAAPYSTWWNGGMRTTPYFRNQIGLLTEIIGNPTPIELPAMADKQLPSGDWPMPVKPQTWHYRQSIDYMIEVERAVVDYASRNRETLLHNSYVMGRRSIEKGSRDSWLVTPTRMAAVQEAAEKARAGNPANMAAFGVPAGSGAFSTEAPPPGSDAIVGRPTTPPIPNDIFEKTLHDPAFRDARGYILPADQDDFPTVVKFINVLLKGGLEVHRATKAFTVAGKAYPAGSFVVKMDQAFRPAVLDTFEPQDHPADLAYPGGPPKRPYDIAGWTIVKQMGVKYDRIQDGFDGPFEKLGFDLLAPPSSRITGSAKPMGYLVSHKQNDAFIVINRLLKAKADVYWLKDEVVIGGKGLGTGTIYVPASAAAQPVLEQSAKTLGVTIVGVDAAPTGDATKLKPIHIGLVDLYGGSMPSGWLRWMFERYEFPFELVFPQVLEAGNLKSSYDVIVFPSDTYTEGRGGRGGFGGRRFGPAPESIPEEYRSMLGAVSAAKTVPPVRKFVEEGGTIVAMGAAATIGEAMGLSVGNYLVETGPDGKVRPLPSEKFYVPGSVLQVRLNNQNPIAYGMEDRGYAFFDSSPVFKLKADGTQKLSRVIWFDGKKPLYSGWAMGQEYLDGGDMATEASVGAGKIVLIGIEATFRGIPHANFKLLFNSLYYGSAKPGPLPPASAAGKN